MSNQEWKYDSAKDSNEPVSERLKSVQRETGLITAIISFFWFVLIRFYLKLFHRLSITNKENLPQDTPFIIISNHTSHLDALILVSILPIRLNGHVFPVAAGDTFFESPSLRIFASQFMNALPIWRKNCGSHHLESLRNRLETGQYALILFPEGTRSRTGELGKFKAGIGRLVAESEIPIIPCLIQGAHEAFPPKDQSMKFKKIAVKVGSSVNFKEIPNNKEGWQQISHNLENKIKAL